MIELSSVHFARYDLIEGCEIYRRDDEMWYVKWFIGETVVESDGYTSKVKARAYVGKVVEQIEGGRITDENS